MTRLRHLVLRHARWSLAALAVAGIVLAVLADRLLPDLVAQNPVTANVAAGILGAPLLLLLAVVLLDRLVAAERRRGWVNRNLTDLKETVPAAVVAVKDTLAAHWPPPSSYDAVYASTVSLIEGLEAVPGDHLGETGPATVPGILLTEASTLRERLPRVDEDALVDAITSLAVALEPLAIQQDAPRLSETALDTRIACQQAASTLESEAYRSTRFLGLLDDLAAATSLFWHATDKAFILRNGSATRKFNCQYVAYGGFGYLEQLSLVKNLDALCDAVSVQIKHTLL